MHQMDTILVAVGVPTKEGAGTTPGHSHAVMLSEGKLDNPLDQPVKHNAQHEEKLIDASNKSEENNVKHEFRESEEEEHSAGGAQENGWDIPDISDLLDSLNVSESEQKNNSIFTCTDGADCTEGSECQCTQEEEGQSDTDSECVPWEWDTKHWSTEHTIKHNSIRTECPTQDQVAKGKQTSSATLPTHSPHSLVTEHTTTAHMDSDEN